MNRYLSPHLRGFGAATIQMLTAAFDNAWRSVQASGASYPTSASAESARATLAKYIIDEAVLGVRDPRELCDGAVAHLAGADRT